MKTLSGVSFLANGLLLVLLAYCGGTMRWQTISYEQQLLHAGERYESLAERNDSLFESWQASNARDAKEIARLKHQIQQIAKISGEYAGETGESP